MRRPLFLILFPMLLAFAAVHAQMPYNCEVHFSVEDTVLLPGVTPEQDSVRFHLRATAGADSLFWYPSELFLDSTAEEQWVTLGCGDTLSVKLTAFYSNANLFHWQQPNFIRTHTGYNYFQSPADGDFCQPRSITLDSYPQNYCAEMDYNTPQQCIIIRPDTLWSYGDSIYPFFPQNNTTMTFLRSIFSIIREFPFDGNHAPFYVDTIELMDPDPNYTYVLNMTHFTVSQYDDSLYSVPVLYFTVNIDDTVPRFFSTERTVPLCDTTLVYYQNIALPHSMGGIGRYRFFNSTVHFNMSPSPRGRAVFRFYEAPTPYYYTTGSYCFSRIEMLGDCWAADSLLLRSPACGCQVRDTLTRMVCSSQLPYIWQGLTFAQPGTDSLLIHAFECDTFRILQLSLLPDDTLSRSDTIVENDLPWTLYGITFTASASDTLFVHGTLPACDTLIYYHLTVIDNVYDTTLTYICPNQLPYTLQGTTVYGDTVFTQILRGSHGQDSSVTYFLFVNPDSDTTIYDTIVEDQLPWRFLDSLFTDTISNLPFILNNEVGCDSIIYYNLHIFWNGDHCDSSLQFANVVTPNGDGINDRFVIGGLIDNQCYPYNSLIIVNRYGRVVYHAENISREDQFWNPDEHRVPDGTYFYRFVGHGINHATQHQGCIEVLR